MSNPLDLYHDLLALWELRLLLPPRRQSADTMSDKFKATIKKYNAILASEGELDPPPSPPFQLLIPTINKIQYKINPAIRLWFTYGCALVL